MNQNLSFPWEEDYRMNNNQANHENNEATFPTDPRKKPEGVYISKRALIVIGSVALIAIVGASITLATVTNNKEKRDELSPTEAVESTYEDKTTIPYDPVIMTSPAMTTEPISYGTTSSVTTETISDTNVYSLPPKDVVEGYSFENLTAEQQEKIRKLDAMSTEEFWALPETEQLEFAWYIYKNNLPRFEYLLDINDVEGKYIENPSTAEEYDNNQAYLLCFASGCMMTYDKDIDSIAYDYDTAYKLAVLTYSDTQLHYDAWKSLCDKVVSAATLVQLRPTVEGYKKTNEGMVVNRYMTSNETIEIPIDSEHTQQTYQAVVFKDINGVEKTISYCTQTISQSDPKCIPLENS